jgi:hydroxyacylglutathione hydrolase
MVVIMYFKQLRCDGDRNLGYIIADETSKKCVLVDPSPEPSQALKEVKDNSFTIMYLINTHSHYDHVVANIEITSISEARIVSHSTSSEGEIKVNDGDTLIVGNLAIEILHTPGHTLDSICIVVSDYLITGDTLFVGMIGGTKSKKDARMQCESLKRLMALKESTTVWPGHDYGVRASSTIKEEKEHNPFCQRIYDFEAFYYLKRHWEDYKREHNIP